MQIDLILSLSKLHYHQSLLLPNLNFTNKIDSANGHSSPYGKALTFFHGKAFNFYLQIILNLTILVHSWCSLLPFSASEANVSFYLIQHPNFFSFYISNFSDFLKFPFNFLKPKYIIIISIFSFSTNPHPLLKPFLC